MLMHSMLCCDQGMFTTNTYKIYFSACYDVWAVSLSLTTDWLAVPISFVFRLGSYRISALPCYNEQSLTREAAMFLVREAVLLARSCMEEEEELDRLEDLTVLMELDLLESFIMLELTLSGVTAMELDLVDTAVFHAGSLGACSELRLSEPVRWRGWSEFLLSEPVLCILLLQF